MNTTPDVPGTERPVPAYAGQEPLKTPELKENRFIYALVLIIAVLAIVCLFVMLFYISQQGARTVSSSGASTTASTGASGTSKSSTKKTASNDIEVVKVTPTLYENGALDSGIIENTKGSQTASEKAAAYQAEVAKRLNDSGSTAAESPIKAPAATNSSTQKSSNAAQSADKPANSNAVTASNVIVGVDEDIAKKNLRAQGFKTYSVYVCDAGALAGSSARPKNGLVLAQSSYTGRTVGEKLAFVNVASSASYANAQKVPNLKGKAWKSARSALAQKGLRIRYEYEDKSPSKYGTVVFQAPAAGTPMPRGCSVVVVLAD